uniref:Endonuclease/exonuclease/phosphatase domain-containing protein n=1 Tax=Chenopodium quinoa TaxID=63459 RepID=A0A803M8Y9_CHEQI
MEKIKKKLKFNNLLVVSCVGEGRKRSGGLALLWKDTIDVTIKSYSQNHIDSWVKFPKKEGWRFTGVYGFPEEENKHKTGTLLENLGGSCDTPWVCGGDFNLMLISSEKQGGNDFRLDEADIFRGAVASCELEDLGFIGHPFTWTNNRGGDHNLQERLDRYLANKEWRELFPVSFVSHLSKRKSDHLPILLCINEGVGKQKKKKKRKLYRFEEMWLRDETCGDIVANAWSRGGDICSKIAHTSLNLSAWSRNKFGDFVKELKECRARMESLMEENQTKSIIAQMRALDDRMDELESREELYWRPQSRQDWLRFGDKNMSFFHTKASQRKSRNHIREIKDVAGNTFDDEEQVAEVMVQHFNDLFTSSVMVEADSVIEKVDSAISNEQFEDLAAPFTAKGFSVSPYDKSPPHTTTAAYCCICSLGAKVILTSDRKVPTRPGNTPKMLTETDL